jgi:hypothetical protein
MEGVCVDKKVDALLENGVEAGANETDCDRGDNPVESGSGGPAKPE